MKRLYSSGSYFSIQHADDIIVLNTCWDSGLVITSIANRLTEYLKLHKLRLKPRDAKIAIILSKTELDKFKPEDEETNLSRVKFICEQFEDNGLNLNFNIYTSAEELKYASHEYVNSMWYFKRKWIGDKNQIMIKKSSNVGFDGFGDNRGIDLSPFYDTSYDIIEFDYTNKFDWILDNMIHSKYVVSERSGLTTLGTFSQVPVYLVTNKKIEIFMNNKNRLITWGNGNLTTSNRIDNVTNGNITQGYYEGPLYNITQEDRI